MNVDSVFLSLYIESIVSNILIQKKVVKQLAVAAMDTLTLSLGFLSLFLFIFLLKRSTHKHSKLSHVPGMYDMYCPKLTLSVSCFFSVSVLHSSCIIYRLVCVC